jgi:hypothetical protein
MTPKGRGRPIRSTAAVTSVLVNSNPRPAESVRRAGQIPAADTVAAPFGRRRRYPDVVLVDRTRERTLLVIEVKRHARLSDLRGLRDVVDQVLEYRDLIRARDPRWRVRAVIVAEQVQENVLARARDAGVEVWRYDSKTQRFRALVGTHG